MEKRTGSLTRLLWQRYGDGYINLTQVRAATGWDDANTADMMVLGSWPSTKNLLEGFEIKVSRADWLNEVKKPHKNTSVKSRCNKWWLVIADENMVKDGELPDDWGMMALRDGKLVVVKDAPLLDPIPLDNKFVASLLRHNDKEQIPLDIHKQTIDDAKRQAEQEAKEKYDSLLEFVKSLKKVLGIEMKQGYSGDWVAVFGRFGRYRSAEETAGLIKSALAEDHESIRYRLESAKSDAEEILKIVNDRLTSPSNKKEDV